MISVAVQYLLQRIESMSDLVLCSEVCSTVTLSELCDIFCYALIMCPNCATKSAVQNLVPASELYSILCYEVSSTESCATQLAVQNLVLRS